MKKCSQCNQNFSDDVTFCPKCGRMLETVNEEKYFCAKCGQQLEADTKFCPKCGALNERKTYQTTFNEVNNTVNPEHNHNRERNTMQLLREQYCSFSGRLNRKRYIIRCLIVSFTVLVLLTLVDVLFEDELSFDEFGMLTAMPGTVELLFSFIIFVVGMVSSISLNVRRLHDLNKSGWFLLLGYVPVINIIFIIYILFFKGTEGRNKYGEDPLQNE